MACSTRRIIFLTAIQDEEQARMQRLRENGSPRREKKDWFRLHTAEEPIRVLLAGCYRLIEAGRLKTSACLR